MWFTARSGAEAWTDAVAHLAAADPVMAKLIDRVGPLPAQAPPG